ncbi:hypothetical protein HQ544_02130 [Candidatus Falkowbacteria bacterium]|nr:hypothetical protein [Candidatus Falkowbacteria bacterium]
MLNPIGVMVKDLPALGFREICDHNTGSIAEALRKLQGSQLSDEEQAVALLFIAEEALTAALAINRDTEVEFDGSNTPPGFLQVQGW